MIDAYIYGQMIRERAWYHYKTNLSKNLHVLENNLTILLDPSQPLDFESSMCCFHIVPHYETPKFQ